MSHPKDPPLFYTLSSINSFDGSTSVIGIFDSMRALGYRLQRVYSTCGDEYHIDCLHLAAAEKEKDEFIEQQTNRAKYQRESAIKEQLYKNFEEDKDEIDINEVIEDEELADQIREERLNVA